MSKLRMRFSKTGRAVYISHLDLMRTIQRAFFRAEYKLKYSEGFNPHAQISIILPLSVGTSSLCELMDFQLVGDYDLSEFASTINSKLPEGIEITEVYDSETKPAALKWLKVHGLLEYDNFAKQDYVDQINELFSQESLIINKKTKRGESDFDIIPALKTIRFELKDNDIFCEAIISAQEPTVNPDLIVNCIKKYLPDLSPDFAKFTRIETYDSELNLYR